MHPRLFSSALSLIVLALPLGAEPFMAQDWRLRQDLPVRQAGLVKMSLPVETLDAARANLADLRLIDPSGQEVAWAIEQSRPLQPLVREPRSLTSTVEDAAMVFVLETGTDDLITALQIDAGQQRFLTRALVETSDDGVTWRLLGRNLPVYDRGGPLRALDLPIPPGVYPRLRISLDRLGGSHLALRGISLVTQRTQADITEAVPLRVTARNETSAETRLTLALPGANLRLATLDVSTPERVFDRPVRLVRRVFENEVIREVALAQGALSRANPSGRPDAGPLQLRIEATVPGRELILVIDNGDSPPLVVSAISAQRRPVFAVFYAAMTGRYTLYTGNAKASAPRYDVGSLTAEAQNLPPTRLAPGPLESNPGFQPGEPLPEIPGLGAALDIAPWGYRKPVRVAATGVQQLELDPATLARAQRGLADLRLISDGNQVPFVVEHTSLVRSLGVAVTPVPDPKQPRLSRWRLALPLPRLPLTRLTATVATPLFQREMRLFEDVEDERGNTSRRWLGQASWSQTPGRRAATLAVVFNEAPETATLGLETDNGDNPPIALGNVGVSYGVTRLLFKADGKTPIFLYYGNPQALAPRYDLSLVGAQVLAADKISSGLGAEAALKGQSFAETIALAGRGGVLFWGMLALVVIVLLVVIARLLPKAPPADRPGAPP
jgi:hypothetical protein